MGFSDTNNIVTKNLLRGQNLILTASIPNRIVRKYTPEVRFLQMELDVILEKFNKKIIELEGKSTTGKLDNFSDQEKAIITKIEKDKKEAQ